MSVKHSNENASNYAIYYQTKENVEN
jgi:hypothetical protein